MEQLKDFAKRLLSRKFILACLGTYFSYAFAAQDGVITIAEQAIIASNFLAFIGVEGGRDIIAASGSINAIGKKK